MKLINFMILKDYNEKTHPYTYFFENQIIKN